LFAGRLRLIGRRLDRRTERIDAEDMAGDGIDLGLAAFRRLRLVGRGGGGSARQPDEDRDAYDQRPLAAVRQRRHSLGFG
jgi:hypothetical protein